MVIVPHPGGPIESEDFNRTRFEHFVSKLSDPVESIRYSGSTDEARISAQVSWTRRHHIRMSGYLSIVPDSVRDDVAELVSFLVPFLDEVDPAFGCASTHFNSYTGTELDLALRRIDWDSIAASREFLRGYSWLTVIPKELVARLGGIAALREAPLAAVYPLTAGGALVLAASTPVEYDDVAMKGLFRTLAPVLPPGKPKPVFGYEHIRVVYEDVTTG